MLAKYTYMCYYIVTGKKESPGELENGTGKREPSKEENIMTRFYDNNWILNISLRAESGEDFSSDFFEDACDKEKYNEALGAYRVEDVEYLVDYVVSYLNGTNPDIDYPEDYDPEKPEYDLVYSVEER